MEFQGSGIVPHSPQPIHCTPSSAVTPWAEFQDLQWHLGKEIQVLFQLSSKQLLLNYSCRRDQEPLLSTGAGEHPWAVPLPSAVPWTIAVCPLRGFHKIPGCHLVSCLLLTQPIWCSRIFPPRIQYQESYLGATYVLLLSSGKAQEQFGDKGFSKERINSLFLTY